MANKRILIVEDEQLIAEDLRETLEKSGYHVIGISASGQDALEKARAGMPELVSMDMHLKGDMDGIETAQQIKSAFRDIPIIFLSSNCEDATLRRAKSVSPWFVRKPFNEREYLETTAKALSPESFITLSPTQGPCNIPSGVLSNHSSQIVLNKILKGKLCAQK